MIDIGDKAPDFSLPASGDQTLSLSDANGPLVLFFYPRDDTPGCTKEAIAFTGMEAEFAKLGVTIWGISADSVKSHDKFVAKHDLTVALLSDEHGDLCERAGCWKEKNMYGKTYMGIERTTILAGADGKIRNIWRKVKVPGHVEEVVDAARDMA